MSLGMLPDNLAPMRLMYVAFFQALRRGAAGAGSENAFLARTMDLDTFQRGGPPACVGLPTLRVPVTSALTGARARVVSQGRLGDTAVTQQ